MYPDLCYNTPIIFFFQTKTGHFEPDITEAQNAGNPLRNNRCQCSSQSAHLQRNDQQQIRKNIENRGQNQKKQRDFAVSYGTKRFCHKPIENLRCKANTDCVDICISIPVNVIRRVHQFKRGGIPKTKKMVKRNVIIPGRTMAFPKDFRVLSNSLPP